MPRLVEVCLLVVVAGILCECAKGKNSSKGRQTCNYFKNDTDHMQGLGNFTDYWKKCNQAKVLLPKVKALFKMLQKRKKGENQSTARMCGMDFSVPDLCCKNIVDCSNNVTERLGLFRGAMEKAQTQLKTNTVLNKLVNKTLERIKDALRGQRAIVSEGQNSSVGIDHVCNTSGRFVNVDVAKDTLSFLSKELKNYLECLKDFKHLKGNITKVRCQRKTEHASRRPKKTTTTTSTPLDGQNKRHKYTNDDSNQNHKQTTKKMKTKKNSNEDSKQKGGKRTQS